MPVKRSSGAQIQKSFEYSAQTLGACADGGPQLLHGVFRGGCVGLQDVVVEALINKQDHL